MTEPASQPLARPAHGTQRPRKPESRLENPRQEAEGERRLPTLIECSTSPRLLKDIVAQLIGKASRSADRLDALIAELDELFEKHRGNLQDALRELYDDCASRSDLGASAGERQFDPLPEVQV